MQGGEVRGFRFVGAEFRVGGGVSSASVCALVVVTVRTCGSVRGMSLYSAAKRAL